MKTLAVPASLQRPDCYYPGQNLGGTIEQAFCQWSRGNLLHLLTPLVYVPIFWWQNALHHCRRTRTSTIAALPEVQDFCDANLRPNVQYFTVVQGDDGVLESVPDNVVVFGAGGSGDIPIPLVCDPHPPGPEVPRELLASFVGQPASGGQGSWVPSERRYVMDPEGGGTRIRRRMIEAFSGRGDCLIAARPGGGPERLEEFRSAARRSRFGLCPRGYGLSSYRLYEMFDFGAVPVYIYDEPWLPYWDELDWREFSVLCHESQIEALPDRLAAISDDQWRNMRQRGRELHYQYFTREGICRQISRYLQPWYFGHICRSPLPGEIPALEKQWREHTKLRDDLLAALVDRYGLRLMVETGTLAGDTVGAAAPRFERCWTIELHPANFIRAKRFLTHRKNVTPLLANSEHALPEIRRWLDRPTLFFLDAHWSGAMTAKGRTECPLLAELRAIGDLRGGHVVAIDDARLFAAPPPPEHDAQQWPRLDEIAAAVADWGQLQRIDDLLLITPTEFPWS